jgi:hypothetical protein
MNNLGTFSALTCDIITDQSVKYKYITKALPWWRRRLMTKTQQYERKRFIFNPIKPEINLLWRVSNG